MGFSEREVAHMYMGKWMELFDQFKWFYNFKIMKRTFADRKTESLMDL